MRVLGPITALLFAGCGITNESGLSYDAEPDRTCLELRRAIKEAELAQAEILYNSRCRDDENGDLRCGWAVWGDDDNYAMFARDFSDATSQLRGDLVEGQECATHIDAELLADTFDQVRLYWRCVADEDGEDCTHGWGVRIGETFVVAKAYPLEEAVTQAMMITGLPTASRAEDTGEPFLP